LIPTWFSRTHGSVVRVLGSFRAVAAEREGVQSQRVEVLAQIQSLVARYFDLAPEDGGLDCPLSVPLYGAEEVSDAVEVLLSQRVTMGERVRAFEAEFADFVGTRHAVMVNSGSSANLLALAVAASSGVPNGLRPGDEVIVPAVTWPTTVAPILQLGCVPVFVDIDPQTLNLDPNDLERAWSPRTRAIFAVHLLGNPVPMPAVVEFARERRIWVLEDACESLGSEIEGRQAGAFGDFGTFSFYFSHHITTVEGGMLVTDDDALADLARSMRAHGWTRDMSTRSEIEAANPWIDPRFLFVHLGYNLRPMEIQAAFGLVQLRRLESFNEARRRNARWLIDQLGDLAREGHLQFVAEQDGGRSTWFGFTVLTENSETRTSLSSHLERREIETRAIVAGNLTIQPAFRDATHRTVGSLANATAISQRGLFIGNHPHLDQRRLDHIVEAFRSFYDERA
jgi:CDP-6-deoxy-D-xylo-4-hexulose-3-dehydrase